MIDTAAYLSGPFASAAIPSELILEPGQAWVLLLTLLVLCCAVLWWLTRPLRGATQQPQPPRYRARPQWQQASLSTTGRHRILPHGWLAHRAGGRP